MSESVVIMWLQLVVLADDLRQGQLDALAAEVRRVALGGARERLFADARTGGHFDVRGAISTNITITITITTADCVRFVVEERGQRQEARLDIAVAVAALAGDGVAVVVHQLQEAL